MKVTLSGKEFTLRCDMRALANAKRDDNIDMSSLTEEYKDFDGKVRERENINAICTFMYHFAVSGAKHTKTAFNYDRDDFLGLIGHEDMPTISDALVALFSGGEKTQKKAKASR